MTAIQTNKADRDHVNAVCQKIDAIKPWNETALSLLKLIHQMFPLPGSGMNEGFTGTHSLTLKDGLLIANIWYNGICWSVSFEP